MKNYRKKPVTIQAFRFEGPETVPNEAFHAIDPDHRGDAAIVHTIEGDLVAHMGDWIIRGVKGEWYPCRSDIFAATYESVEE